MIDVDVLVVGYGPVGAAIAALLGRYGVRTLVVDKLPGIFMAPRAIALDNEALRILQTVGLGEDAFAKVVIPYVRMHSPRLGEFGRINTSRTIDGHPMLVTFYQPELERALRTLAEAQPTVEARSGVEMVDLDDEGDAVRVVLRAGAGEETVRARYVVGVDGACSTVRRLIGEDFVGETYTEDWLIVDALGAAESFDHVEFVCDPDRPTPHMVAPGGRTRWEFMLKPGETREEMESDAKLAELLRPWVRAEDLRIERKAVYRFHARACRRFGNGRVFLAGDAAHITPPFAGQGLVAGLRDAVNLAWKLAWVVRDRASASILDSYDEERRPHAVKMIRLAKFMGQLVMPRSHARAVVVHGAMALLRRLPPMRRLFDDLGMKPQNAFAKGLFVRGRGGAWLPQARVRWAGSDVLSDDVLGLDLALVGDVSLSDETKHLWEHAGGRIVRLDDDLVASRGRCVVVRPDRTILHAGAVEDAERIVHESLAVLRGGDESIGPAPEDGRHARSACRLRGESRSCGRHSAPRQLAQRSEQMPANEDLTADMVAASPVPFVVTHPCPACHGRGMVDGQTCPGCHATGVARFFHGTKADLKPGDLIGVGQRPNFGKLDRTTTYVYLTGTLDAATWGAELALGEGPGRIYIVEPTGPIENDPNLTDKKFPGNPTRSYRSREPLRVKGEVTAWRGHSPEQLNAMTDGVRRAKEQEVEPIDD